MMCRQHASSLHCFTRFKFVVSKFMKLPVEIRRLACEEMVYFFFFLNGSNYGNGVCTSYSFLDVIGACFPGTVE